MSVAVANCFKLFVKLSNFKGNSDIERYQMANKKIPFKYTRPVEDWLQEKGKSSSNFQNVSCHFIGLFPLRMNRHPVNPQNNQRNRASLLTFSSPHLFIWIYFPFLSLSFFLNISLNHGIQLKGLGSVSVNSATARC